MPVAGPRGEFAEERRLITALFADISGFTALAQRVDSEELVEIIDPLVARLGAVVARFDGTVEKYAGDAILAVFGAPRAHDDDATRALLVALEMHREVARAITELGPGAEGLTLHIGVNSGHVIARVMGSEARLDYGVLGDSVIVAQRLEAQAPGGETYVGASTVALVGDRFRLDPVGELSVKGKAEPVAAWRLLGERRDTHGGETPTWTGVEADVRLVGREHELAHVMSSIEALSGGRGGVVTVLGPSGVGKSTLVAAAARIARAAGIVWLTARCVSYGRAIGYAPYAELIRSRAGISVDDPAPEARRALSGAAGALGPPSGIPYFARMLGLDPADDEVGSLEPEAFQRGLHRAMGTWLTGRDGTGRILLVEDLQWADEASLALTAELVVASAESALLVVLTGRPEAEVALRAVAERPEGEHGPVRDDLVLEPFDADDTARLARAELGDDPVPDLVRFLHDRTDGNPFFVVETIRGLREAGAIEAGPEGARLVSDRDQRSVPPTIEGLLSARIDDLPARDREILHVASIVGRRVHEPMLRGLLADPSDLEAAIGRLVDAGLLDHEMGDGEHVAQFHHALVQDVAYSRLLRRRRRELHLRAADTAERLYGSGDDAIDLLAGHLYLGRAGARAVEALLRAADRARRLFANAEAILALERAEESAMADATATGALPRIRLELAQVLELVGSYEPAIRRYEEVREATGDPRAWRGLAAAHRRVGDYELAIAVADDGLAAIAGSADPRPLILERAAALSVSGRRADALALLEATLETEPATDDPVGGHLLLQLARARTVAGRSSEAIPLAERAVAILEQAGDPAAASSALRVLGNAYSSAERIREAEATLARGLSLAERVGSSEEIGGSLINLGVLAMDQGRADDAIDSYRRAVDEFERIGHASGRVTGYANLADALLQRGDLDEALEWAGRAVDAARSLGHALGLADALDTMATIHGRRGEPDRAADLAVEAARAYGAAGAAVREAEALAAASAWRDGARHRADHSKPLRPGGPSSIT